MYPATQSKKHEGETVMMRAKLALLCVFLLALCLPLTTHAQKFTGTITGTVTDPSGAVVPGVSVTVVNDRTGASRTTTTNDQGSFSFPELDAGTYTMTVNKAGFKKLTEKNVELHVADVTALKNATGPGNGLPPCTKQQPFAYSVEIPLAQGANARTPAS